MAVIWNEIRLRQDSVDCWSPFVDNIGGVWWTTWSDLEFDFPKCVKKKNWVANYFLFGGWSIGAPETSDNFCEINIIDRHHRLPMIFTNML